MKWLTKVAPWCRFCGWRWRWGWIEFDYQCPKHWDDGSVWKQR